MMRSSCVIQEFPIPEREYRVSAPDRWDERTCRRPPRRPCRRRSSPRLLPALLALALVFSFLLGRASATRSAGTPSVVRNQVQSVGGEEAKEPKEPGVMPEEPVAEDGAVPVTTLPAVSQQPVPKEPAAEVGATLPAASQQPAQEETPAKAAWNLVLINWENPLPEDFTAPELTQLANGHAVDSRIYPELQRMMDDAKAAGVHPTICSSFRTWEKQEYLFKNKIRRLKNAGWDAATVEQEAARWVARPGTSEHQAGLAVDIVDKSYTALDHRQETTAAQKWLMAHCSEYGFILRYPSDKEALTGVGYEPWHYRYVGVEAAKAIMEQGICLEEYLSQ